MKVLVTGVGGQLGFDVVNELLKRNICVIGSDILPSSSTKCEYRRLDFTDAESVESLMTEVKPDVVIHCGGWTAVDAAEDNIDKVFKINHIGTENIAKICAKLNCKMMFISTDYVFNGEGQQPWDPDKSKPSPLNIYGLSKVKAESSVKEIVEKYFIVRISWAFGINGNNFVKTMINLGKKYSEIRVINDQIGTPTYTFDLAKLLVDIVLTDKYGVYHATNSGGFISWYDFACEIFRQAGYNTKVVPVTTLEYGGNKAKRPLNSRLDKSKLVMNGFTLLPDWKNALQRYLSLLIK